MVGYSRAVRVGEKVFVSGTVSVDETGNVIGRNDPYKQTKRILEIIESALLKAGANPENVVRTRIYVTDINYWQEVGRAHAEMFSEIRPASTLLQVSSLVDSEMLVEIEVDAVIKDPD